MNYFRIYDQIIHRAQNRIREENIYYEKHHIVPRCLKGCDEDWNLVYLTAREHFLAHWLLARMFSRHGKLIHAFWYMCNQKGRGQKERYTPSSRTYKEARELARVVIGNSLKGKKHSEEHKEKNRQSQLGRKHSEESRKKISEGNKGKKISEETRRKMSEDRKGKPSYIRTSEHKEKMRQAQYGRDMGVIRKKISDKIKGQKRTPEQCQKISESQKGKIISFETRSKMSRANIGRKHTEESKEKIRQTKRNKNAKS